MAASPQGYYVITPLELLNSEEVKGQSERQAEGQQGHHDTKESQYVLINRGWVPRHMVFGSSNQQQQQHQQQRRPTAAATSAEELMAWDRTTEVTQVTVIPTQGEGMYCLSTNYDSTLDRDVTFSNAHCCHCRPLFFATHCPSPLAAFLFSPTPPN
jgi:SURF1 family